MMSEFEAAAMSKVVSDLMANGVLPIVTITTGTEDYGDKFVARIHVVDRGVTSPTGYIAISDTLDGIRKYIPPFMMNVGREKLDLECIVESWL